MRRSLILSLSLGLMLSCAPTEPAKVDAGDANAGPSWKVSLEHLDGALLSMWGASPTDLWTVGGPRGNLGFNSLVLRFDGSSWKRQNPGGSETYWWVHGTSATDIWMVGEKGRITHWDGGAFKEFTSNTTATLFGVWAASPTDAWAVGGTPEGGSTKPNDILLHWDGVSWTPAPVPTPAGRTFFKVWGIASDNLYVVGEAGTVWHRTGTTWNTEAAGAHGTLLTVFGCSATEVYAVGSRDVLRSDGKTWTAMNVSLTNDVNGVACGSPGDVVIVGSGGMKQRLTSGAWQDDFGTVPYSDLHGAWADKTGNYWGVGGDFISNPQPNVSRQGVIARYGK